MIPRFFLGFLAAILCKAFRARELAQLWGGSKEYLAHGVEEQHIIDCAHAQECGSRLNHLPT